MEKHCPISNHFLVAFSVPKYFFRLSESLLPFHSSNPIQLIQKLLSFLVPNHPFNFRYKVYIVLNEQGNIITIMILFIIIIILSIGIELLTN